MQHDLPFDPTYGYDLPALLRVGRPDGPADFADFWRGLYARASTTDPRPALRRVDARANVDVYEIEFYGLDGFRVGGWLTMPAGGGATCGRVVGHGYGGRDAPDFDPALARVAAVFPSARGFGRSARADVPGDVAGHVLHGIGSRETYVHGLCAADLWCATSALLAVFPELSGHVDYAGQSFGGGIGAMALPWEPRWRRAFLDVPSFGNHPLRLALRCTGSGEFVRHHARHHPRAVDVLRYFDAATAAAHARTPTLVAAALFDPAVPPPGQFAVYNALAGEKRLFVRQAGHFPHPGEAAEDEAIRLEAAGWFDGDDRRG